VTDFLVINIVNVKAICHDGNVYVFGGGGGESTNVFQCRVVNLCVRRSFNNVSQHFS
jgi:hypothetical protein